MCGIVGLLGPAADDDGVTVPSLVRSMAASLHHRGPDARGFVDEPGVSIGMTRLSIIDLDTGNPPIANEDRTVWVVFNGEIYNYAERRRHLEAAGHTFRTNTDTEVIVHEYEESGAACVENFRGMFAFAVWDAVRQTLLLARDRFGLKPLYVMTDSGRVAFASEIKALKCLPWCDGRWDASALASYLRLGYCPGDRTAYTSIRKVLPGSTETWEWSRHAGARLVRSATYWSPTAKSQLSSPKYEEAVRDLRERLQESVRLRLRSDVPFGAFLSGGVDSSAIVAAMRMAGVDQLSTFSIGFEERRFNELPFANEVARHFHCDHHTRIVTAADAAKVPAILSQFDEPFADSSAIPTYFVSELAKEHVTVVLTGDGGDELFGGYGHYRGLLAYQHLGWVPSSITRCVGLCWSRVMSEDRLGSGFAHRLATDKTMRHLGYVAPPIPAIIEGALSAEFRSFLECNAQPHALEELFAGNGTVCEAMLRDQRTYLVDDILAKVDRMSMMVSLEARVPLLDHVLADFVNDLPLGYKVSLFERKRILRTAVRHVLPRPILERRKQGFGVPLRQWLQGPLRDWVRGVLMGATPGVLREDAVRRLLEGMDSSQRDFSLYIWRLLALAVWSREQGTDWV